MRKFNVTQHCRERYVQRIPFTHGENLLMTILSKLNVTKDITEKIFEECPRYILHLLEKYKSAGQRIFLNVEDNIIFIAKKRPGTGNNPQDARDGLFEILTCYKHDENYLSLFKESVQLRKVTYEKIAIEKKKIKASQW